MRNISNNLKEALNKEATNLARCWKITLKNKDTLAFTTADEPFVFNDITYNPISANDVNNIKNNSDVSSDNCSISNIISSDLISANDILSGKYDGANIEVFIIDLSNINNGKISLLNGKISDIEYKENLFTAKVKGLKDEIDKTIGEIYSPLCRTKFCDKRCKLETSSYKFFGSVKNLIDSKTFSCDDISILEKTDGYFEYGVIEFLSGKNFGQKMEVRQFMSGVFMMADELPYNIEIGSNFSVIAGCDKQFKTCCNKFNNAINFRGEPHLPGAELLFKVV